MNRRRFLQNAAWLSADAFVSQVAFAAPPAIPIIDTHIHLFDTSRKGGVPWPEASDTVLYRPALPDRYLRVSKGLGIVGAIAIEASPDKADNDWLLQVAAEHPMIVGVVGNLIPGDPDFARDLERLRQNPLFLGIRHGNLWKRDLSADLNNPGFKEDLRRLARAGLVFESANPDARLIDTLKRITDLVPDLTVVVDHLPHAVVPVSGVEAKRYNENLKHLSSSPTVYVKLSEIVSKQYGPSLNPYRSKLDQIWEIFGEEKLMFGSDWPNSDHELAFADTFSVFHDYLQGKSAAERDRVYWRNSMKAYRWKHRTSEQPTLASSSTQ